jgi:hypothetical protein
MLAFALTITEALFNIIGSSRGLPERCWQIVNKHYGYYCKVTIGIQAWVGEAATEEEAIKIASTRATADILRFDDGPSLLAWLGLEPVRGTTPTNTIRRLAKSLTGPAKILDALEEALTWVEGFVYLFIPVDHALS